MEIIVSKEYFDDPVVEVRWMVCTQKNNVIEFSNPVIVINGEIVCKGGIKEAAKIIYNALKADKN